MSVRLFVGNLPYDATEAELRQLLSAVSEPSVIVIPVDRESGRLRGFAFVEFTDRAKAEEVIKRFDGQPFKGRSLAVSEARPREQRPAADMGQRASGQAPEPAASAAPAGPQQRRARNFGPDAAPRRSRGGRSQKSEGRPKGPIPKRPGGRFFDVDDDSPEQALEPEQAQEFENLATGAAAPPPDKDD